MANRKIICDLRNLIFKFFVKVFFLNFFLFNLFSTLSGIALRPGRPSSPVPSTLPPIQPPPLPQHGLTRPMTRQQGDCKCRSLASNVDVAGAHRPPPNLHLYLPRVLCARVGYARLSRRVRAGRSPSDVARPRRLVHRSFVSAVSRA